MVKQSYFKAKAEKKKAAVLAAEDPYVEMENWLRTKGFARFAEKLNHFGIESVVSSLTWLLRTEQGGVGLSLSLSFLFQRARHRLKKEVMSAAVATTFNNLTSLLDRPTTPHYLPLVCHRTAHT